MSSSSTAGNSRRDAPFVSGRSMLGLALAAAFLIGCGGDDQKKPATQVVAKVNQEELSVHQVNFLLSRLGQVPAGREDEAKKRVVDRLVEQELLVQKAVETKLDRDPNVMMALDAARREVLAQAYLDKTVGIAQKPTAEQVEAYYAKRPELFAERKVYRLRELALATDSQDQVRDIKAQIEKGASLDDLAAWAKARNIAYRPMIGVKPAEQLPLEHLASLHALKEGQVHPIEGQAGLLAVQVLATQKQSIDAKTASPVIEQYLLAEARKRSAAEEMSRLRAAAKIEYTGLIPDAATVTPSAASKPAAAVGDSEAISQGLKGVK